MTVFIVNFVTAYSLHPIIYLFVRSTYK